MITDEGGSKIYKLMNVQMCIGIYNGNPNTKVITILITKVFGTWPDPSGGPLTFDWLQYEDERVGLWVSISDNSRDTLNRTLRGG